MNFCELKDQIVKKQFQAKPFRARVARLRTKLQVGQCSFIELNAALYIKSFIADFKTIETISTKFLEQISKWQIHMQIRI